MIKKIGININSRKDKNSLILHIVKDVTEKTFENAEIVAFYDSIDISKEKDLDFIISVGGDGTVLRTVGELGENQVPIIGVNIGHLGFLTAMDLSKLKMGLVSIKEGKYKIQNRMLLDCVFKDNGKKFLALNDIVVSKGALSRIVDFTISIDNNHFSKVAADGMIISTPTGSTAYAFSCGGPLISPDLKLIELTAICPHSNFFRTLILSDKAVLTINVSKKDDDQKIYITSDGQQYAEINENMDICISSSSIVAKFIHIDSYDYYDVLNKKIINRKG